MVRSLQSMTPRAGRGPGCVTARSWTAATDPRGVAALGARGAGKGFRDRACVTPAKVVTPLGFVTAVQDAGRGVEGTGRRAKPPSLAHVQIHRLRAKTVFNRHISSHRSRQGSQKGYSCAASDAIWIIVSWVTAK